MALFYLAKLNGWPIRGDISVTANLIPGVRGALCDLRISFVAWTTTSVVRRAAYTWFSVDPTDVALSERWVAAIP
jgi:hypothetical protein